MSVVSLRQSFSPDRVREIPDMQGVYTLWDGKECVYVGHTPWNMSLRDCMREHLALLHERIIRVSHFNWEITGTPKTRETELLATCLERQNDLPRYNRESSPIKRHRTCVTDLRAKKIGA